MSATQEGVESTHEKLMAKLAPSEPVEPLEQAVEETVEESLEVAGDVEETQPEVTEEVSVSEPSET